jgi:hypothetical protein
MHAAYGVRLPLTLVLQSDAVLDGSYYMLLCLLCLVLTCACAVLCLLLCCCSVRIEWIIIWLIAVELVVGCVELLGLFGLVGREK